MNQESGIRNKKIHFVGIGGIGISALAQWYISEGWRVSGSDVSGSVVTKSLAKKGAKIFIGAHKASNLPKDAGFLVYTVAAHRDNPERAAARKFGIPEKTYAEGLGELTEKYKTIAISGAHGKSTTTAMAAIMLIEAGFDPTVIIGTRMKELGDSNFRKGKSDWLLIEADEYHSSFLNYRPFIILTTNIDREHMEYYKTFAKVKRAFEKFYSHISKGGFLIRNGDHKELSSLKIPKNINSIRYSINDPRSKTIKETLNVPGRHNLSNALACDKLGEILQIRQNIRNRALARFHGTWRRFEYKGQWRGAKIFDDYAHHPTEIKATLEGAREAFPKSRIVTVFQPHLSERLEYLFKDFLNSFKNSDIVAVLETFKVPGRDGGSKGRDARALADKVGDYLPDHKSAAAWLSKNLKRGDVAIFMGAGDVKNISERLGR